MKHSLFVSLLAIPSAWSLRPIDMDPTAGGHTKSFLGWSSFPLQAYKVPGAGYGDGFLTEENLLAQATAQSQKLARSGYEYFMIDSGWSVGDRGDDNGRITWDPKIFKSPGGFPAFVKRLNNMGLKVGIYVVPGVFNNDFRAEPKKRIAGSRFTVSDVADAGASGNSFGRVKIDFEKHGEAGLAWTQSVVDQFANWGVDLIKLDFLKPTTANDGGQPDPNEKDNYGDVAAYRTAIGRSSRPTMWLLESYALSIDETNLPHWRESGDSYRITTDINNAPTTAGGKLVSWGSVQRAFEAVRIYISVQLTIPRPLKGYADLDSVMIGNSGDLNNLTPAQRRTYFSFWVVSGVPLYLGDDMTKIDNQYLAILTDQETLAIHRDWTSKHPAFFVNPEDGSRNPSQLQVWAAGPFGDRNEVVVLLANMGCAESNQAGFKTCLTGKRKVTATFKNLQIEGSHCNRDVFGRRDTGRADTEISRELDQGESVIFRLTPVASGGQC